MDSAIRELVRFLAVAILISGLDDLIVDAVWVYAWLRGRLRVESSPPAVKSASAPHIAIFVPLWQEHAVIGRMLDHNIAAIDYQSYEFFVGVYPNDDATLDAVRDAEARHAHVHVALCAHDGPTSKADCLNWIYQRMLLYEDESRVRFDAVVTHDAEDLIDADALTVIAGSLDRFGMVQVPVLPLPTPIREIVHGIYCDEFAESQTKDMLVRRMMGSFTPSAGVGTAYSRAAIEKLAESSSNRIFEPGCLTEDYENGIRLHALGMAQAFVPISRGRHGVMATREYFPRKLRPAIRQRTRWVTGIALQTWQRHGWKGSPGQIYWLWRDRKGLIGNPLSLLANIFFIYGAIVPSVRHALGPLLATATVSLLLVRTSIRMVCVGRLYGTAFALAAPFRCVCANYINAVASLSATYRFFRAKLRGEPLVWLKTEHGYPSRAVLLEHKRKLGEVLVGSGYLEQAHLERALQTQPAGVRIGEHLLAMGMLTEEQLLEALSLQQGISAGTLTAEDVAANVARALPRSFVRTWRVLPFRIASGSMFIATSEIPTDELTRELRGRTRLEIQFRLVTEANLARLVELCCS